MRCAMFLKRVCSALLALAVLLGLAFLIGEIAIYIRKPKKA